MKSILLKTITSILLINLIFPFCAFSGEILTNIEKNRIESKLRNVFKLQKKSVANSLMMVEKDLENFLFGPGTSDRLLRYFNKWVRPAESDNEQLWKAFQKEVINKDQFISFVDDLVEIHFRVYDRLRRDTNREFVVMNLSGIPEIEYSESKRQLKSAVAKIWQMNEKELREIIYKSAGEVKDVNKIKDKELYVMAASIAMEVGAGAFGLAAASAVCPICSPVLLGASVAIVVGWFIYQEVIKGEEFEAEMATAQQRFMINMEKQLENVAKETKEEFRASSDLAYRKLVDTITAIITEYYPQIQKENLV